MSEVKENLWKKHSDKIHKIARETQDLIGVGSGHLGWVAQQKGRDDDEPTGIGFVLDGDKDKVVRGKEQTPCLTNNPPPIFRGVNCLTPLCKGDMMVST